MNNSLSLTGFYLDDQGAPETAILPRVPDADLDRMLVKVLMDAGLDRHEMSSSWGQESWASDSYGTPADSPFSERASALLRDNTPADAMYYRMVPFSDDSEPTD